MRLVTARFLVFALLVASTVSSQPVHFGDLAPLTPTRYTAFAADSVLATNGRDLFVFWNNGSQVRVTRYTGEPRVGRAVLDAQNGTTFDVVWTGSGFLVVGSNGRDVVARLLDAGGEPVGAQFTLAPGYQPRVAFDGARAVIVYTYLTETSRRIDRALVVDRYGNANGAMPVVLEDRANGWAEYAIAANGNGFTIISVSEADVKLTTLSASGAITSSTLVTIEATLTRGAPVLATNGRGFLAAWLERTRVVVQMIDANGVLGRRMSIDSEANDLGLWGQSVVWNDRAYELAYGARLKSDGGEVRRVLIDADGALTGRDAPRAAAPYGRVATGVLQGRSFLSWRQPDPSGFAFAVGPLVVQDVTSGSMAAPAAFAASQQNATATAASADGVLVLWQETLTNAIAWYAGVRANDGSFIEHEIGNHEDRLYLAASDGHGFAIVDTQFQRTSAILLGPRGDIIARTRPIQSFVAQRIASNGDGYVIVGRRTIAPGDIVAVRISTSGEVSEPVVIVPAGQWSEVDTLSALASDGTNYLVVWDRLSFGSNLFGELRSILATRLDPSLRRLDAEPIVIAGLGANAVLTPSEKGWTVTWSPLSRTETHMRTIDANGAMSVPVKFPVHDVQRLVSLGNATLGAVTATGALNIVRNNFVYSRKEFGADTNLQLLVRTPRGGAAYVKTRIERDAPYHGSDRIAIAFADEVPLPIRPDAPRATARIANGWAVVEWTAPPQRVTGYRVEYRVGDGSWNELETSLDAGSRATIALQPRVGVTYAFRVRALNEGGAGAYSAPITVAAGRRQVVRR